MSTNAIKTKMVLVGNILCVVVCVLETFAVNSLWIGWGQITAIFKDQGTVLFFRHTRKHPQGITGENF